MDNDADMLDAFFPESSSSQEYTALTVGNTKVLEFINDTIAHIHAALNSWPHGEVKVVLKRVNKIEHQRVAADHGSHSRRQSTKNGKVKVQSRQMQYSWPGNTPEEAWRFACILAILHEINTAVHKNVTVTKRDIYYRQPELFRKQETVDRYIDDIAFTCGVTRKDLRVTASPKGVLCGLNLTTDPTFNPDTAASERVQLVPNELENITTQHIEQLRWILVVEKEASFKTLVEKNFESQSASGAGLIVTAKGYPDLSTRLFLRHIIDLSHQLSVPNSLSIFSLVDCDPDGLDIHRCYTTATRSSAQEQDAAISEIKWLGVDMVECLGTKDVMDKGLPLTRRDRGRARGMLERMVGDEVDMDGAFAGDQSREKTRVRRCLQTMLMLGVKMEIQAIDDQNVEGGLCGWLESRMWEARGY